MYVYDGLDEQELSFPPDVYILLLRKDAIKKKIDGESWWEGVYQNKLGFFPAIFVEELDDENTTLCNVSSNTIWDNALYSPEYSDHKNNSILSPFSENQKVPQ